MENFKSNPIWLYTTLILLLLVGIIIFAFINISMKNKDKLSANIIQKTNNTIDGVALMTNFGEIQIEFYKDQAPKTVNNFISLVEKGFYDGTKFHRVIPNFMVQGGDPLSKDDSAKEKWGTGGPGYFFDDEIGDKNSNVIGTIAMANSGPNTNGSQFFINVADNNFLDTKHTVFGKITKGIDVVMKISQTQTTGAPYDHPLQDVIIEKILVK